MFGKPFLSHIVFDGDTGSGGGSGGGDTSTGEGTPPGDDGGTGGAPKPAGGQAFTQADVDRIAGQTRQQALSRWAKEQGFDNPDEILDIIKAKKEADDQAQSDLQKAEAKVERFKTQAAETEQRMYNVLLRSAFDRVAGGQVEDLDLAFLAAKDLGLLSSEAGITVDLESLKVEGVGKAVKVLLEQKPILKKSTGAKPPGTGGSEGGTPPPPGPSDADKRQAAKRFGVRI